MTLGPFVVSSICPSTVNPAAFLWPPPPKRAATLEMSRLTLRREPLILLPGSSRKNMTVSVPVVTSFMKLETPSMMSELTCSASFKRR